MSNVKRETLTGETGNFQFDAKLDAHWSYSGLGDLLQGLTDFWRSPTGEYFMAVLENAVSEENSAMRMAIQRGETVSAAVASGRVDVLDLLRQEAFGLGAVIRDRMEAVREAKD